MKKIILFTSITIFSSIGWWLGAKISMMTGFWVSTAGSLLGVYIGVKFNQNYLG
jgi:hypothetical protein